MKIRISRLNPLSLIDSRMSEFVKFAIVGFSGVLVNLGVYLLLTRLVDVPLEIASPIAIEASILWNFVLNDRWTFGYRIIPVSRFVRLIRFHAVCAFVGVLNYTVLLALVHLADWWDVYANLAGIVLGVIAKFILISTWTWRQSPVDTRG